jgi:hypothetical protein
MTIPRRKPNRDGIGAGIARDSGRARMVTRRPTVPDY